MLRRVALVRTYVSEELSASIIRVIRICEVGTTLAVTSNRCTLHRNSISRIISPKGREILKTIGSYYLKRLSTEEPAYWPSERNKLPDPLDFCVKKDNPQDFLKDSVARSPRANYTD
jgi:hypothetical protein